MRKVINALACSSLVAAFCCSVCFAQTSEISRAGKTLRKSGVDTQLPQTPRELLKRGKDLFLQGHYDKALEALEQVPPDAELSETDADDLEKLLKASRSKASALSGRKGVTARAQSPDTSRGTVNRSRGKSASEDAAGPEAALAAEARRLADAPPAERKAAASKWLTIARAAFNQGDVGDAEQIAQAAVDIDAPFKASEDSPEKLLAEIQEARKQDTIWKNDQSSPQAKRNRSNYLLRRAQQAARDGDVKNAQKFVADAEKLGATPGQLDINPADVRKQIAMAGKAPNGTGSREMGSSSRTTARRDGKIQQVGFEGAGSSDSDAESAEMLRAKADGMMRQAKTAERQGKMKEALRAAQAAAKLEAEAGLTYARGEEKPSQFLATLMRKVPADPASLEIMEQEASQETAAVSENTEMARELIAKAKQDMARGDIESARLSLEHAADLKVPASELSESPEELLAQLDRPAKSAKGQGAGQPSAAEKQKAKQLLAEAKAAYDSGDLVLARAKTLEAKKINVTYDLFEEDPHQVEDQLDRTGAKSSSTASRHQSQKPVETASAQGEENPFASETASRTAARTGARTGGRTGRRTSGLPMSVQKQRALELLDLARAELKAGRIDDAKRLAMEAKEINTVYALFEDRPEMVLADIEQAELAVESPGNRRAAKSNDNAKAQVASETREPDLAKRQAMLMLRAARADLKAGRLKEAEEKAIQAEKMDAEYADFEDNPSIVLKEIEKQNGIVVATRGEGRENPYESDPTLTTSNNKVVNADVISPEGDGSALSMFKEGKLALARGDRAGAYHMFLQASQSGEVLNPRMKQQLEDFLQTLSPKNRGRGGIRMVSNVQGEIPMVGDAAESEEAESNMPTVRGDEFETEPRTAKRTGNPTQLEAVDQQVTIKLESLRTQVMNTIFRADKLREKDPEGALKMLDKVQHELEISELSKESISPLLKSVTRARDAAQATIQTQMSNITQVKHNKKVDEDIKGSQRRAVKIEQEFADMTQQFNELMQQRRFPEAEIIAKKAKELDPSNPTAEIMVWKAKFGFRVDSNNKLRDSKEEGFWAALDSVEHSAIPFDDRHPIQYGKNWNELSKRRKDKYGADNQIRSDEVKRIEKSLSRQVSLHFDQEPLQNVIEQLSTQSNINIRLDPQGLEEQQVKTDTPITINVDGIQMRSALNLILEPLQLGYAIKDEVLKITSVERQKGDMERRVYPVADLVIPIPNFVNSAPMGGYSSSDPFQTSNGGGAQYNIAANRPSGQAFAQVQDGQGGMGGMSTRDRLNMDPMRQTATPDFDSLVDLIVATVEPTSWDEVGGQATVKPFETTLSLVIRQTQQAHDEIQDLLAQLRRLQDLQVAIEVRFVTVSDKFFERIGIDFDFNMNGTTPVAPSPEAFGDFLPPFGNGRRFTVTGTTTTGTTTTGTTTSGTTTTGTTTSGTTTTGATTTNVAGTGSAPFSPGPGRDLVRRGDYPKLGTIVGLERPNVFSNDLQIPFRQGSFDIGVPDFGGYKPDAGLSMGFAILSDIETFFFIQAAQGDSRTNILFAPKVTLFNGQQAIVEDTLNRPFVVGQTPVVGAFTVAFTPNVRVFSEGVTLRVNAVISADRRYVRLSLVPDFRSITDVFTFSFSGTSGSAGGGSNQSTGFGGGSGTNIGGIGGGGGSTAAGGTNSGGVSGGGTSGGSTTTGGTSTGGTTTGGTTTGGTTTGAQNIGNTAPATQVVQQPVQEVISIQTSVSVPDGGTVLLGGIKRLKEGRNMQGVPILNKLPYISRLFKNSGVGRETDSLMMMVTPRIIIQEEEEAEVMGTTP